MPAQKWDWFKALDADKEGLVTEAEWLAWNKQSGAKKGDTFNEERQKEYFAGRDADGDGQLTRKELEDSRK